MNHNPDESTNSNAAVLRSAIAGLTARDRAAVLACFHNEGILELPYERSLPRLDKAGLGSLLEMLFDLYGKFSITLTHIYDLVDADTLIARYEGDCVGRGDNVPYANNYIAVFEFTDGLISYWREYDNPMITDSAQRAHAAAAGVGDG